MSACCQTGTCPECVRAQAARDQDVRARAALAAMAVPASSPPDKGKLYRFAEPRFVDGKPHGIREWWEWEPPAAALHWSGNVMLAFWRNLDLRAVHVALLARRIGHIDDHGLLLRVMAIALYDQARNVMDEMVEVATRSEQRVKPRTVHVPHMRVVDVEGVTVVAIGDAAADALEVVS